MYCPVASPAIADTIEKPWCKSGTSVCNQNDVRFARVKMPYTVLCGDKLDVLEYMHRDRHWQRWDGVVRSNDAHTCTTVRLDLVVVPSWQKKVCKAVRPSLSAHKRIP